MQQLESQQPGRQPRQDRLQRRSSAGGTISPLSSSAALPVARDETRNSTIIPGPVQKGRALCRPSRMPG